MVSWRLQVLNVSGAFPALQKPLLSAQPPPVCFITYSGNRIPLGVIFSFSTGCSKLDPLPLLSSDRLPFCGAIFRVQFLHLKQKMFPFCTVLIFQPWFSQKCCTTTNAIIIKWLLSLLLENSKRYKSDSPSVRNQSTQKTVRNIFCLKCAS